MIRELLKQALYALKYHSIQTRPIDLTNETIEALRQELAKPEQEPVGYFYLRKGVFFHIYEPHNADPEVFPLYTAPLRKPWIGLTEVEIGLEWHELHDDEGSPPDEWVFAHAIEAKLKEKNT